VNGLMDAMASALSRALIHIPTSPASGKSALDAAEVRRVRAAYSHHRAAMRKRARTAWVSAPQPGQYVLHVAREEATRNFHCLDSLQFDNFKAAQSIANAIRAHIAGE